MRLASGLTRSWAGRAAAVLLLVLGLLAMSAVPAGAAPTVAEDADTAAVAAWPVDLQQLVNGTQAFSSAPWFTQGPCANRGGDVAGYINTFFRREVAFRLEVLQDLYQKVPDLIDATTVAESTAPETVFPNGNAAYEMPVGTCADDLLAWTTGDDSSPWGFTWVSRPDPGSLPVMQQAAVEQPGNPGDVLDAVDPLTVCAGDNQKSYLCARAFFVNCDVAPAADKTRCQAWNTAVQRHLNGMNHWIEMNTSLADRVGDFLVAAGGVVVWVGGGWVISALGFLLGKLGEAIDWAAKKGMDQVVSFAVAGAVWLWGKVIGYLIDQTTPNPLGGGFVDLYNLVSGIMMGLAFLIFLAGLVMAWKRGRLAGSLVGAVKAVIGIQIVGIIAWLMLELANQATKALIDSYADKVASSQFTLAIASLYPPVAIIAAILLIFGLIGTAIVLAFQAPATIGHALFGTVGAAGQANQATSHWLGRWFIRLLSLAWCKFFMVAMTLLAMNLIMPTAQNSQQNFGQQFFGVLLGLALMIMLPTTPWLLSGLMSFSVGHASRISDSMAMGLTEKLGKAALAAAAGGAGGGAGAAGSEAGGSAGGAAGGGSKAALGTMANNLSGLDSADAACSEDGQSASDDGQDTQATGGATDAGTQSSTGDAAAAAARSGDPGQDSGPAGARSKAGTSESADAAPTGSTSGSGQTRPGTPKSGQAGAGQDGGGLLGAAARGRSTTGVNPAGSDDGAAAEEADDGIGDAMASPQGARSPAAGGRPAGSGGGGPASSGVAPPAGQGPSARAASSAAAGGTAATPPPGAVASGAGGAGTGGSGSTASTAPAASTVPAASTAAPAVPISAPAPVSPSPHTGAGTAEPAEPESSQVPAVIPVQLPSPGSRRRPTPPPPRLA